MFSSIYQQFIHRKVTLLPSSRRSRLLSTFKLHSKHSSFSLSIYLAIYSQRKRNHIRLSIPPFVVFLIKSIYIYIYIIFSYLLNFPLYRLYLILIQHISYSQCFIFEASIFFLSSKFLSDIFFILLIFFNQNGAR